MALLSDRDEVLVVALGELGHHVLRALRQLAHHPPRGPGHSEQVDDVMQVITFRSLCHTC